MGKLLIPNQFKSFYNEYKDSHFRLLDVGCGNHSAQLVKKWFENCKYFGMDKECFNNDEEDFRRMEKYYEIDLEKETNKLDDVPNRFFDVILFNHVIEHIHNGIEVLSKLTAKLKQGGKIYIEFPSVKSLSLPKMRDTFNFCDDPTHVRIYNIQEIANELLKNNFQIIKAGPRKNIQRITLTPVVLFLDWVKTGRLVSYGLWDLFGFAEYVYAKKL